MGRPKFSKEIGDMFEQSHQVVAELLHESDMWDLPNHEKNEYPLLSEKEQEEYGFRATDFMYSLSKRGYYIAKEA